MVTLGSLIASLTDAGAIDGVTLAVTGAVTLPTAILAKSAWCTAIYARRPCPPRQAETAAVVRQTSSSVDTVVTPLLTAQTPEPGPALVLTLFPSVPSRALANTRHVITLADIVLTLTGLCACVTVARGLTGLLTRRTLPSGGACAVPRIRRTFSSVVEVATTEVRAALSPLVWWTSSFRTSVALVPRQTVTGAVLCRAEAGMDASALSQTIWSVKSLVTFILTPFPRIARRAHTGARLSVTRSPVVTCAFLHAVRPVRAGHTLFCTVPARPSGLAGAGAVGWVAVSSVLTQTVLFTIFSVSALPATLFTQRPFISGQAGAGACHVITGGVVVALTCVLAQLSVIALPALFATAHAFIAGVTQAFPSLRNTGSMIVTLTLLLTVLTPPPCLTVGIAQRPSPSLVARAMVRRCALAFLTLGLTHG